MRRDSCTRSLDLESLVLDVPELSRQRTRVSRLKTDTMRCPTLTLSEEAHEALVELAATHKRQGVPRLKELQAAALTVDQPKDDDVVLRARNGAPLLAVSRRLMDHLGGEAELIADVSAVGELSFRLVREPKVGWNETDNVRQWS